jgi:hypothetical protein
MRNTASSTKLCRCFKMARLIDFVSSWLGTTCTRPLGYRSEKVVLGAPNYPSSRRHKGWRPTDIALGCGKGYGCLLTGWLLVEYLLALRPAPISTVWEGVLASAMPRILPSPVPMSCDDRTTLKLKMILEGTSCDWSKAEGRVTATRAAKP